MKPELLVIFPNRPDAMAQLEERYKLHHLWQSDDKKTLISECADRIQGIVTSGEHGASAQLIASLPKLKIISCYGVGVDAVDPQSCKDRDIIITNTPDVLSKEVADMGIALMLTTLRRLIEADQFVRDGQWEKGNFPLSTSATGKTLGILGMGRIGAELAKRAKAMDMKVCYHNRRKRDDVDLDYADNLVDMAKASDVLMLCCPGGDATRGLINAEVLKALGKDGYLINVARGSVVDEPALIAALTNGTIKAAGLDVFANEPVVPAALKAMNNVVLQPHAASATTETRDAMAQLVVDNLDSYFRDGTVITRFN